MLPAANTVLHFPHHHKALSSVLQSANMSLRN